MFRIPLVAIDIAAASPDSFSPLLFGSEQQIAGILITLSVVLNIHLCYQRYLLVCLHYYSREPTGIT
jgi:hypothetical protein